MKERIGEKKILRQLNPVILKWAEVISKYCLIVVFVIAATVLSGWFIPEFGKILPDGWASMQVTSSLSILFIFISIVLGKSGINKHYPLIVKLFFLLCMVLVGVSLIEHWYDQKSVVGALLVPNEHLSIVHPTSIQSATAFLLLALTLIIDPSRHDKVSYLLDILIFLLVMLSLLYLAGYIYKAETIIQATQAILISPQSLICIVLLTFVQAARRAPFGSYSILVSNGIAAHTARIVLPFSVIIIYFIVLNQSHLTSSGYIEAPNIAAITASLSASIVIIVVMLLSNKIEVLEDRLHNMSLIDELTGIYNLRGLNIHGKQMLLEAKRSHTPLSVIYFDIDGLKNVNDSLGHDVGSELIRDIAMLLRDNFRESDIVARIGGDEFVIIAFDSGDGLDSNMRRLNEAVDDINSSGNRQYVVGFSAGKISIDPQTGETLENLISMADDAMYKTKMKRRAVIND